MPSQELVDGVRSHLPDDFSRRQLDGAMAVLTQENNPARASQSASSFRELIAHVLEYMAPGADVVRCAWFKQDDNAQGPTRRQRALYACRGGLTDEFLQQRVGIKPETLHAGLGPAFQELNKRTHVRPDTELTTEEEIEEFAESALAALDDLFETIDEMKDRVATALSRTLSGAATAAFVNQTIAELDEIAGRYETGMVLIDEPEILGLDADWIRCRFTGTVGVTLLAGGRNDGVQFSESFPFECGTSAPATSPESFNSADTTIQVDVSSWRE